MYDDDKVHENFLALTCAWYEKLRKAISRIVGQAADHAGVDTEAKFVGMGAFKMVYKVQRFRALCRFPILGQSAFRHEKTNDECMMMQYLSRHTAIPLPRLIAAESCDVGPYLVMAYVEGKDLSACLEAKPTTHAAGRGRLNPNIDTTTLAQAYRGMARILIELSKCRFAQIGAVGRDESKQWCVTKRAVTINMNQIVSCGNYPANSLAQKPFATANEYFTYLAETHLTHLRTQRNDAIDDETDARRKYVARCLFLKISRDFSTKDEDNNGPFPLYCDDLRPSNVLVDDGLNVRSVIDWEYCYAAPVELTYCSPWWLLLKHPDDWPERDLSAHGLFIQVLREEEGVLIQEGKLVENQRLSSKMAESVSNGHFWFCQAATSSYGFDDVYWKFVDPVYYGTFTSIEDRIRLLRQKERDDLEPFVQLKVRQAEEATVEQHWTLEDMFNA